MDFDISQISNKYLRDLALVSDANNDKKINQSEKSIFELAAKSLKDSGLCTDAELLEVLPQEAYAYGGVKTIISRDVEYSQEKKDNFDKELEELVQKELTRLGLEDNSENRAKALENVKEVKRLNLEITKLKAQKSELEKAGFEEKFKDRNLKYTLGGASGVGVLGGIAGGMVKGGLTGTSAGPLGIIGGVVVGGLIGGIAGGVGGNYLAKWTLAEEDVNNAKEEFDNLIKDYDEKINQCKVDLAKYN